ncbi:MAG: hypothetical protein ACHQ6T_13005 [Myxococcota bacterium]
MTRTRRHPILTLILLLLAAPQLRAGEPKTYRWVGEDGHVYTSTTPPPNGKGLIETAPAAAAPPVSPDPAAAPAAAAAAGPGAPAAAAAPARAGGDGPCARYESYVQTWRIATNSVEAAESALDALQSDTNDYVRRDDSYYEGRVETANRRVESAKRRLSQVESDAMRIGVPQNCFTE